jgi:bifunctional non-homologous end joining protein LigD
VEFESGVSAWKVSRDWRKAPLPGFIEPALATSIEKVPSGARWIHEIKFDGYRVHVHLANEAVKIFTHRGHDWTHRFKKAAHDAWHIKAGSAIIDGEIVVPASDGTTTSRFCRTSSRDRRKASLWSRSTWSTSTAATSGRSRWSGGNPN